MLGFDDDGQPRAIFNGVGPDFIVFENAFFLGSESGLVWAELLFVDVSTDGETFVRFPAFSLTRGGVGPFGTIAMGSAVGFAGSRP